MSTPALAYTKTQAAEALAISLEFFNAQVLPEIRVVRRGRKVLVPHAEIVRWLERSATLTLEPRST